MANDGNYGYYSKALQVGVDSLGDLAGKLTADVADVAAATDSSNSVWDTPSYAQFRVKLDDYESNAAALSRCVNAVSNWVEEFKANMDIADTVVQWTR